jgi:hypothetical protein
MTIDAAYVTVVVVVVVLLVAWFVSRSKQPPKGPTQPERK